MVNCRVKPGRMSDKEAPSRRSIRTQNEWKVETIGVLPVVVFVSRLFTRWRISSAALLVKVTASTAGPGV